MNIKLRTDILSKSLILENLLSGILSVLLHLQDDKSKSKSLGYTGNALSFKAKADLLNDLKRLKPEEYVDLVTFMEIRNKLIHNLDIDTLKKAAELSNKTKQIIGNDSELKTKFSKTTDPVLQENLLKTGLQQLFDRIIKFSKGILETIIQESEDEVTSMIERTQTKFLIDIDGFIRNSFETSIKVLDNYSKEELNEIITGLLIFFYHEVSKTYPKVYQNIQMMLKMKQGKRS